MLRFFQIFLSKEISAESRNASNSVSLLKNKSRNLKSLKKPLRNDELILDSIISSIEYIEDDEHNKLSLCN